jgi:hypothetical protein
MKPFLFRSTTSTCSLPSIDSGQPPRKKLEEVSGFVVVTKQNYFRPIRKKLQNQKQQECCSEQEIYCVEDQRDTDHYSQQMKVKNQQERRFGGTNQFCLHSEELSGDQQMQVSDYKQEQHLPKSSIMRKETNDDIVDEYSGIHLRNICDEKENGNLLVRKNGIYNPDLRRQSAECQHSQVPTENSSALQILPLRNSLGDGRRDWCNHKQDVKVQTRAESCVEEVISPMKQSPVFSSRVNICAGDCVTDPYVCAQDRKSDVTKLEKIEAIEGWIKIYENEFFNERNKVIDNEEMDTSITQEIGHNTTVPMQGPHTPLACPMVLLDTREKTIPPAGIQTPTNFFHNSTDAICDKQDACLSQTVSECSGFRPRTETSKKSPSIKQSQRGLDSLKHFSSDMLEGMQLNKQKFSNTGTEEMPLSRALIRIHQTGSPSVHSKAIKEYVCDEKPTTNERSYFSENTHLLTSNSTKGTNCPKESNSANAEGVSIEPICTAVHVNSQQCNSFQLMARPGFMKRPSGVGHNSTLEQIEAMIEPKTEDGPSREITLKERKSRTEDMKPEQVRTSGKSLMSDIVKVKLGIDNQSKILDRLDLMMKHNKITDRGIYKIRDNRPSLVSPSETSANAHKANGDVPKPDVFSCKLFSGVSSSSPLGNSACCKSCEVSEARGCHTRRNVSGECRQVSATQHMPDAKFIGQCLHDLPQCSSLQKFSLGQNEKSGYVAATGHAGGKCHTCHKTIHCLSNIFCKIQA